MTTTGTSGGSSTSPTDSTVTTTRAAHTVPIVDPEPHRTDIQVAELRVVDGRLTCDRDAPFNLDLRRASRHTVMQ